MKINRTTVILISITLLLMGFQTLLAQSDIDKLEDKFSKHLYDVYIKTAMRTNPDITHDLEKLTKIIGYALAQQLKYIQKNTDEHRLWLELEQRQYKNIEFMVLALAGHVTMDDDDLILFKRLLARIRAGMVGVYDAEISTLTGVEPGKAPSIFFSVEVLIVEKLKGRWKLLRSNLRFANQEGHYKIIELTDSIVGLGYKILPQEFTLFYWVVEDNAIQLYDTNGNRSYSFQPDPENPDLMILIGHRYHRGEIYQEIGKAVPYYLVKDRS